MSDRYEETTDLSEVLKQARVMAHKGQIASAVKILVKGMEGHKANKDFCYCLAEILINERQHQLALNSLNDMPKDLNDLRRLELTGYCMEAIGRDEEACECTNRMLYLSKNFAPALFLKGKLAVKKGGTLDAEKNFLQAINTDDRFGPAYTCLGLLKKESGLYNEALDLLEKGFINSPTNNNVLTAYHKEASAQGVFARAERIFKNVFQTHPRHRLIHFKLIDLLLHQEKLQESMIEIEKALVEYGADDGFIMAALHLRRKLGPKEISCSSKQKASTSLCMIIKDEEQNIGKCLLNLKNLADEMIVVDTGSSDRTKVLAGIFGAKVFDFEWNNDFSAARNYSISQATGDWILIMDADEIISPGDFASLKNMITVNKYNARAFSFITRNYHVQTNIINTHLNNGEYKDEEAGYGWTPSEKVRLFRNGLNIRFEYPVHEVVGPSLKYHGISIEKCEIPIHHYGKLNLTRALQKSVDYFYLGIKKLEISQNDAGAIYELAIQAAELQKWEEAINLWQRYNDLIPTNPSAYVNMGTAYIETGIIAQAIQSARKAMALDPDMNEPCHNYALYEILNGNAELAIPVLQRLEQRSPEYLPARFKLAVAYTCAGKKEDASRSFKELKMSVIGKNLLTSCQSMVKELARFGQIGYAESMTEMAVRILVEAFI
jgi:tetratricopeptide (TPR) repeat protein